MSIAWWEKFRYLIWSLLIIVVTATSIVIMSGNLQDLERNRIREYQALAEKISGSVVDFIMANHYDDLLDMMRLMAGTPNIDGAALFIDGTIRMHEQKPDLNPAVLKQSIQGKRSWLFVSGRNHYFVVDIILPYHPDLMKGRSSLRIVFSLRAFLENKNNIILATGLIILLVLALMISLNLLAKADESKAMVVQAAAHTSRKVLSRIILRLENLIENTQGSEKRRQRYFRDIKRCIEEGYETNRFLKNLNTSEKINHNKFWLHCTNIDLAAKLKKFPLQLEMTLAKAGKRIQLHLPSEPTVIWAANDMVEDILENLIDNAVKYTEVQTTVNIRLQRKDDGYEILICDHGPGVEKRYWEKIFKPHTCLLKEKSGSGLGLSNARALARLLDGEVGIRESIPGKGSDFFLFLPKNLDKLRSLS